jgi:integrase
VKRERAKLGSVVLNRKTWMFQWWDNGKRQSKAIGSKRDFPTKAAAWRASEPLRRLLENPADNRRATVQTVVAQYREEKMPERFSTKRGYDAWLNNHILKHWADKPITDVQARPVELWLESLELSPKSKVHIRGILRILWDYAMWAELVPTQRNPMELVDVEGASKRTREPINLTVEQFHTLLKALGDDLCWRTLLLLSLSFGLRVSEALGLQWQDVDWLGRKLTIKRGVVKQIVGDVKSAHSAKTMVIADELLEVLKQWKQATQFSAAEDWVFASPVKLGRQPLSYTYIWETLTAAAEKAGIPHFSSHTFRHTYRTWLGSVGTPVGVQQKLMRHADIRTTMNIYGDAVTEDMREAHQKVVAMALGLNGLQTECKPS